LFACLSYSFIGSILDLYALIKSKGLKYPSYCNQYSFIFRKNFINKKNINLGYYNENFFPHYKLSRWRNHPFLKSGAYLFKRIIYVLWVLGCIYFVVKCFLKWKKKKFILKGTITLNILSISNLYFFITHTSKDALYDQMRLSGFYTIMNILNRFFVEGTF